MDDTVILNIDTRLESAATFVCLDRTKQVLVCSGWVANRCYLEATVDLHALTKAALISDNNEITNLRIGPFVQPGKTEVG